MKDEKSDKTPPKTKPETGPKTGPKSSPKEVRHKAPIANKKGMGKDRRTSDKKPAFNSVVHPKDKKEGVANTGISRPSAVLLALLATLAGGAIGWGGPALFTSDPTPDLQTSVTQLQSQLETQSSEMDRLEEALGAAQKTNATEDARLQSHIDSLQDITGAMTALDKEAVKAVIAPSLTELETGLAELKPQIETLGTDINTRIDVLETSLSKDGVEIGEGAGSQALLDRFTKLESSQTSLTALTQQFSELQTQVDQLAANMDLQPSFPAPVDEAVDVPSIESVYDSAAALRALVDSFPRAKMLETVHAQDVLATEKPSWLQRLLSRHVKVRDTEGPTPIVIIDAAQTAIIRGDIDEALAHIAKLNPPVRAIASDWVSAAKKTAKSIAENASTKGQP